MPARPCQNPKVAGCPGNYEPLFPVAHEDTGLFERQGYFGSSRVLLSCGHTKGGFWHLLIYRARRDYDTRLFVQVPLAQFLFLARQRQKRACISGFAEKILSYQEMLCLNQRKGG